MPVISAATQARGEGYFRLEWKLAVDRSHLMAHDQPFMLPVVIDATPDSAARVPPEFKAVQWTRLMGGETPPAFCTHVQKLLGGEAVGGALRPVSSEPSGRKAPPTAKLFRSWLVPAILVALTGIGLALWPPWKKSGPPAPAMVAAKAAALTPAQELVAKARTILDQNDEMNRQGYILAEELLQKAELLDPTDASAWALHANQSANPVWFAFDPTSPRLEAMRGQASRAQTLAPNSAEARRPTSVEPDSSKSYGPLVCPDADPPLQGRPAQARSLITAVLRRPRWSWYQRSWMTTASPKNNGTKSRLRT